MTLKRILPAKLASATVAPVAKTPISVVLVTMDSHMVSAGARAEARLRETMPGLSLTIHAASEWAGNADKLARCQADIASGDIIINSMLFMEDHFQPILPTLSARRDHCDAMVSCMSSTEVMKLTRIGKFQMDKPATGIMAMLKRLKGDKKEGAQEAPSASKGAQQMKMLRRLPRLLRFVPGTAQDVRAYFLTMQYWLAGSEQNIANLVHALVDRYADGPRKGLRGLTKVGEPVEYPEVGLYHPRMTPAMSETTASLPSVATSGKRGTVGLLLMRSYVLAGNADHYDGVITAMEARGLRVIPTFATGLDARPAIDAFFMKDGRPVIDALVSLTGFSLVGGPAYNDSKAAETVLSKLDVPYLAAHPVEFQTLDQWGGSQRGLLPVESTIMVAIPELDGAAGPIVFGGRGSGTEVSCTGCSRGCTFKNTVDLHDMHSCVERADTLAARVGKLVDLRRSERASRKIAAIVFNFPPNAGNTGTAAFLSVFESLFNTMTAMKREGYTLEVPADVDVLRNAVIHGNAEKFGAQANVHTRIPAQDHVRREKYLKEIEAQWGPAPGKQQSDGSSIFVLGAQFGNVFVGIQPAFGYEGDPMRLLFEKGFAPTHAFSAFYRWLREDFGANAVLHFGTHGALEFMPGKQSGLSATCWPDRLIGDLPNLYLYASNNPSEGTIAKRRAAATLISYLTPPVARADLYKGLIDLKDALDRYRSLSDDDGHEQVELAAMIQSMAAELELAVPAPEWGQQANAEVVKLTEKLLELEYTLIPHGLHVVGQAPNKVERIDLLLSMAEASHGAFPDRAVVEALVDGDSPENALTKSTSGMTVASLPLLAELSAADKLMAEDHEIDGILHALDGKFLRPAPGGDLLRTPAILPTGRNLHGFDPYRIPSAFACKDGARQAARLLQKHMDDGNAYPESIAIVLWGTDNLKSEGGPIAQAMALMGVAPRFDAYGRLAGAQLTPLSELARPRVDVIITLSGIFRDLMPLQIKMLAEAAFMAASADEPLDQNFIRKHALAYQAEHGGDLETASLRVFGNAEGAYGSNINSLVDNSRWEDGDELAETYSRRKGFAYGRSGRPVQHTKLLQSVLAKVDLAYQNLDSVELGVTTVDTYFDTLGGISRAIKRAKGPDAVVAPVYIGDQTRDSSGGGVVRTLNEQVSLETRTRMLNPKWYEGMLKHGYEGVRQIEVSVTNTLGWSATTGQVDPWVYQKLTETFMLDPEMRERLAALNPTASAKVANRLLEAQRRNYWSPDETVLAALREASQEIEDRIEGVFVTPSAQIVPLKVAA